MKSELPNLLSAASVLLAIITALFGLFYPSIKSILDIMPKSHPVDNKFNYNLAKEIAKTKLLPLLIGSISITIVFIPELVNQLRSSYITLAEYGINNASYDTLTAAFIAVCIFMVFLTIVIVNTGYQLLKQINKLKPN